jgi:diaminohydroxyphosphoribosylaminopyrimidine deaminase/5-amino-6-(5-phosphoribosylamino)uracil reductase
MTQADLNAGLHADAHAHLNADPGADNRFITLALALGRRGLGNTWPNPAVGAVVVRDGVVVGRGWTQPGGRPHAEVVALRQAGAAARGATLYVTLEPCSHYGKSPPCADAVLAAGIARVVSAIEDPNPEVAGQGHARLRAAGIVVDLGLGAEAARLAHASHISRIVRHRPQVTLKLAVSADRKAGRAGRKPVAITGEMANARVHLMRAQHDAILIGIGTAIADDPLLTCRLPGMAALSPVRVVLDRALRLPLASRLVQSALETPLMVLAGPDAPAGAEAALRAQGAEVLRTDAQNGGLNLPGVLSLLNARGITRLFVEGGPTVAAAFLNAGLVDMAVLLRSPNAIGADGIDALEGLPLEALTASPHWHVRDSQTLGTDTMTIYERT